MTGSSDLHAFDFMNDLKCLDQTAVFAPHASFARW
jgi:hypothetical protein